MSAQQIKLIVGLANPGSQYAATRHNAGAWFVEHLAHQFQIPLKKENKLHALVGKGNIDGHACILAIPTTYMNLSGQAVQSIAHFYKIKADETLIVHDELDKEAGAVRLKVGGGNGGHNGLKDIHNRMARDKTIRLRIGIGHPGHASMVSDYVLGKPSADDKTKILNAIDLASREILPIIEGKFEQVMNDLHRKS